MAEDQRQWTGGLCFSGARVLRSLPGCFVQCRVQAAPQTFKVSPSEGLGPRNLHFMICLEKRLVSRGESCWQEE